DACVGLDPTVTSLLRSVCRVWNADCTAEDDSTLLDGGVVVPLPVFRSEAVSRKIGSRLPPPSPKPPDPNNAPGLPPQNEPSSAIPEPRRRPPPTPASASNPMPRDRSCRPSSASQLIVAFAPRETRICRWMADRLPGYPFIQASSLTAFIL